MKDFGAIFREILRRQGLTQRDAAARLDVSQSVISYYSHLTQPPRRRTLRLMAERLNVTIGELQGQVVPLLAKPKKTSAERDRDSSAKLDAARVMENLKRRWKSSPSEHDAISHLVAVLFPEDSTKILAWLRKD